MEKKFISSIEVMGNRLSWWPFREEKETGIVMVGLDCAGKTTILYKLQLGEVVTTIPTIGFNVETVIYKNMQFFTWDVGGEEGSFLRPLWKHYYQTAKYLIFVVDSNDRERIEDILPQLNYLMTVDELKETPLLIYANKQDLPNIMSVEEIEEALDLHSLPPERPWHIQPCCAISGDGLKEGLNWLASDDHPTATNRFKTAKSARK